jgi:hypothetical protein
MPLRTCWESKYLSSLLSLVVMAVSLMKVRTYPVHLYVPKLGVPFRRAHYTRNPEL